MYALSFEFLTLWCLRTFSDTIKTQAKSINTQIFKEILLTDLQFDTSEFYETATHRHAELYINGGNYGEIIELEILNYQEDNKGHFYGWKEIADGKSQSLAFNKNGQIRLVDNCVTQTCIYEIKLKFSYHKREYFITFNIDVTQ